MIIGIDADTVVYQSCFTTQRQVDHEVISGPIENTLSVCKKIIESMLLYARTQDYKMFLSADDGTNYRLNIAKTEGPKGMGYKQGRGARPAHYEVVRDYLITTWGAYLVSGMETDDALGIWQMQCIKDGVESVISHTDKDINQVPGQHMNLGKEEWYTVEDPGTLELTDKRKLIGSGVKWFWAQMLMGDKVDNIPGCPHIGDVTAFKVMEGCDTEEKMVHAVWDVYLYGTNFAARKEWCNIPVSYDLMTCYDRFLEVADLLWVLRHEGEFKSTQLAEMLDGRIKYAQTGPAIEFD